MFWRFRISKSYQYSTIVKIFENARRSHLFWTHQISTKNNKMSSTFLMSSSVESFGIGFLKWGDIKQAYFLRMFPNCFFVFLKYVCDNFGVHGSRFCWFVGSSTNDPKSIGICLGTLISNFGIIKTPTSPGNTIKILETNQKTPKLLSPTEPL